MPKSVLNNDYEFDEKQNWVVSIFNSGTLFAPHAVLLVEGIRQIPKIDSDSKADASPALSASSPSSSFFSPNQEEKTELFVGQYDIFAPPLGDDAAIRDAIRQSALDAKLEEKNITGLYIDSCTTHLKTLFSNREGVIASIKCYVNNRYTRPGGYEKFKAQSVSYYATPEAAQALINNISTQAEQIAQGWRDSNMAAIPRYQFRGKTHPFGDKLGGINCSEWCYGHLNAAGIADDMHAKPPKRCTIM